MLELYWFQTGLPIGDFSWFRDFDSYRDFVRPLGTGLAPNLWVTRGTWPPDAPCMPVDVWAMFDLIFYLTTCIRGLTSRPRCRVPLGMRIGSFCCWMYFCYFSSKGAFGFLLILSCWELGTFSITSLPYKAWLVDSEKGVRMLELSPCGWLSVSRLDSSFFSIIWLVNEQFWNS